MKNKFLPLVGILLISMTNINNTYASNSININVDAKLPVNFFTGKENKEFNITEYGNPNGFTTQESESGVFFSNDIDKLNDTEIKLEKKSGNNSNIDSIKLFSAYTKDKCNSDLTLNKSINLGQDINILSLISDQTGKEIINKFICAKVEYTKNGEKKTDFIATKNPLFLNQEPKIIEKDVNEDNYNFIVNFFPSINSIEGTNHNWYENGIKVGTNLEFSKVFNKQGVFYLNYRKEEGKSNFYSQFIIVKVVDKSKVTVTSPNTGSNTNNNGNTSGSNTNNNGNTSSNTLTNIKLNTPKIKVEVNNLQKLSDDEKNIVKNNIKEANPNISLKDIVVSDEGSGIISFPGSVMVIQSDDLITEKRNSGSPVSNKFGGIPDKDSLNLENDSRVSIGENIYYNIKKGVEEKNENKEEDETNKDKEKVELESNIFANPPAILQFLNYDDIRNFFKRKDVLKELLNNFFENFKTEIRTFYKEFKNKIKEEIKNELKEELKNEIINEIKKVKSK